MKGHIPILAGTIVKYTSYKRDYEAVVIEDSPRNSLRVLVKRGVFSVYITKASIYDIRHTNAAS